jgi:hypothetical protein
LVASSDDDNWLLCGNFGYTVFTAAYKARLIGPDAFYDEVDHVRVAMFIWACLQTHLVLQSYIDLEYMSHDEVEAVVVQHLINTTTAISMHASLKTENVDFKSQIKVLSRNYDRLEQHLGRQESEIKKRKDSND